MEKILIVNEVLQWIAIIISIVLTRRLGYATLDVVKAIYEKLYP